MAEPYTGPNLGPLQGSAPPPAVVAATDTDGGHPWASFADPVDDGAPNHPWEKFADPVSDVPSAWGYAKT
jgi:hypothetical protein